MPAFAPMPIQRDFKPACVLVFSGVLVLQCGQRGMYAGFCVLAWSLGLVHVTSLGYDPAVESPAISIFLQCLQWFGGWVVGGGMGEADTGNLCQSLVFIYCISLAMFMHSEK